MNGRNNIIVNNILKFCAMQLSITILLLHGSFFFYWQVIYKTISRNNCGDTEMINKEQENVALRDSENSNQDVLQRKWYFIDRSMMVAKLAFTCGTATFSSFEPYLFLILISAGLDPVDAGLVGGLRFIGDIIGSNILASIGDSKKCHRLIIFVVCSGALISMVAQPFVILWLGISSGKVCLKGNSSQKWNTSQSIGNYTLQKGITTENFNEKHLFYALLIVNTMVKFFDNAYRGFLDSGVIERCRINPSNPNFGFQRMFGAIGFAIGILTANAFVESFPETSVVSCYTGVFLAYILFTIILLILTQLLFKGLTFSEVDIERDRKFNVWKVLIKTLNGHAYFFLATVLLMGIQQSFYVNFTFLRLKEMNAPSIIYGLNMAAAALASGAFFFAATWIIDRVGGAWPAMISGIFAYFVRFMLIALATNPWFIPLIQTLQAICFGLFLTAAVLHVKSITRPEIRTTMYTIMNSLHFGLGILIANLLGGKLYKDYGGRTLFMISAITALI